MMAGDRGRRHLPSSDAVPRSSPAVGRHAGEPSTEVTRELTRIGGLAVASTRPARELGTPLLFIHGLFAASWMFERWTQHFAERGRRVFALDLRGHGESDGVRSLGRVSLTDYIQDGLSAARALGPVVAVGHSMGGLVAQKLAELGAVEAAVLVSPAPPRGIPLISWRLVMRQAKYLPALVRSREIRVQRPDADAIILNQVPDDERAALFSRFQSDSGRAGREIMLGALAVDARRVRCPLLVLAGERDHFVPSRVARRVAAKYNAPLRVLPDRGHLMMREPGWEVAAGEAARWIEGL